MLKGALALGALLALVASPAAAAEVEVNFAPSLPTPATAGAKPVEKVVVVTGIGPDQNAAIKNALSRAVEEAVGVLVDAQTAAENEKIIHDQILTYSNGVVSSYEAIRGWTEGGLVNVKIRATVQLGALRERLQANHISTSEVAGESLFANAVTSSKRASDARAMLLASLKDFPVNLMSTDLSSAPRIVKTQGDDAVVGYSVRVAVDRERYRTFAAQFATLLQQTGHPGTRRLLVADDERAPATIKPAGAVGLKVPGGFQPPIAKKTRDELWHVCIQTAADAADRRTQWADFPIEEDLAKVLAVLSMNSLRITAEFLDASGQPVLVDEFPSLSFVGDGTYEPYTFRSPVSYMFGATYEDDFNDLADFSNWRDRSDLGQRFGVMRRGHALTEENSHTLFISPYFVWFDRSHPNTTYVPYRYAVAGDVPREIKLAVDDLRRVKKVRATLKSDIPLPPDPDQFREQLEQATFGREGAAKDYIAGQSEVPAPVASRPVVPGMAPALVAPVAAATPAPARPRTTPLPLLRPSQGGLQPARGLQPSRGFK